MTPAEALAAIEAAGHTVRVTSDGILFVSPRPQGAVPALVIEHKPAIVALLLESEGHCARLMREEGLPDGLIPVIDAKGRAVGWMLDPAWKP